MTNRPMFLSNEPNYFSVYAQFHRHGLASPRRTASALGTLSLFLRVAHTSQKITNNTIAVILNEIMYSYNFI